VLHGKGGAKPASAAQDCITIDATLPKKAYPTKLLYPGLSPIPPPAGIELMTRKRYVGDRSSGGVDVLGDRIVSGEGHARRGPFSCRWSERGRHVRRLELIEGGICRA